MEEENAPYPHYCCAKCGKRLPLTEARFAITCEKHKPSSSDVVVTVRNARSSDRAEIENICDQALGETDIESFGQTFNILEHENLIAIAEGRFVGIATIAITGGDLAIVFLSVYPEFQGLGVGAALVDAVVTYAAERNLPAVKAAIGNDDIPTLSFFQRHGFIIDSVAKGLLADRYGSAEPGFSGIPVRDEIRLSRPVCGR